MKSVPEPIRLLDPDSNASPALRQLLSVGQDAFGPKPGQLAHLEAFVGAVGAGAVGAAGGGAVPAGGGAAGGAHAAGHALAKTAVLKLATLLVVAGGAGAGAWSLTHPVALEEHSLTPLTPADTPSTSPRAASGAVIPEPESARPFPAASVTTAPTEPAPPPASLPLRRSPAVPLDEVAPHGASEARPAPKSAAPTETELELLTRAQGLALANPREALRVLEEHKARFPHGVFEQEREVLIIEALLHTGHENEARRRAAAFTAAFPDSAHGRRILVLLGDAPRDK